MTENTTETTATETATEVVYERGTWQAAMQRSAKLYEKAGNDKKRAGVLLWQGGTAAIADWMENSTDDNGAEGLAADLLEIMGTARKGDVSKIKTVALAVRNHGLETSQFRNLSQAYAEATRLTKTVKEEEAEDTAADEAVSQIDAPKSTTTAEGAAALLLAQGVSEAIRLLFDVLNGPSGEQNHPAHRAFVREAAAEAAGRVPKAQPKKVADTDKEGAAKATKAPATKATPAKTGTKPAAKKATPAKKAVPSSASKGDPNKKALPKKAEPAPVEDPSDNAADMFDEFTEEPTPAPAKKAAPTKPRAVPVKRA